MARLAARLTAQAMLRNLIAGARRHGLAVERVPKGHPLLGDAFGTYDPRIATLAVREDLTPREALGVLAHECCHVFLHAEVGRHPEEAAETADELVGHLVGLHIEGALSWRLAKRLLGRPVVRAGKAVARWCLRRS